MTIKEAILKSLEDLEKTVTHWDIYENIKKQQYYDVLNAKTPESTISAQLGDFIRKANPFESKILFPSKYKELEEFSYDVLENESEIEKYCLSRGIPFEENINE